MGTYTLYATNDTYIDAGSPSNNFGSSSQLGLLTNSYPRIALIKFDLSSLPPASSIISATLRVTTTATSSGFGGAGSTSLSIAKSDFNSATVTYNTRPGVSADYAESRGIAIPNYDGAYVDIPVTQALKDIKNGLGYGFWLGQNVSDVLKFISSAEGGGSTRPTLIVTTNTAPNVPTVTSPSWDSKINTRTPTAIWNYSDPDNDPQSAFLVQLVNSAYNAVLWDSGWITSSATSYPIPSGVITADGSYYIRVQVKDSNGAINQANGTFGDVSFGHAYFTIDTVAPVIESVSPVQYLNVAVGGTYRLWAYNVTDNASGINIVRFPTWRPGITNPIWYNGIKDGATNNWYCDVPIADMGGAEGEYLTHIYAYDNAGNYTAVVTQTFVDRTAPTITSVQGYSYTNQTTGTRRVWAYDVADSLTGINYVQCYYMLPNSSWSSMFTATKSGSDYYYDVPLSVQGEYTVRFYAIDNAGNGSSPYDTKFFVDSQRANDPVTSVEYDTAQAVFTWGQFSDPAPSSGWKSTEFYLGEWNGTSWGTMLYNGTSIGDVTSKTVTGLIPGQRYRYTVTYHDNSGNESAYTYRDFVMKKKIGTYKTGTLAIPVYDPASGVLGSKALRVGTAAGVGCLELVPTADISASPLRISTPQGVQSIAK